MDNSQTSNGFRQRIHDFFYETEVPYGLALTRICLPLALLITAIPRWFATRELYSLDGAAAPLWESYGYPGLLPIPAAAVAVTFSTLYVLSLCTLSVGWMSRTSAAIALVMSVYLGMLDSLSTLTKFTAIAAHLLLLLSLSQCGSLWSVDAWLARRRNHWPGEVDGGHERFPAWPRRLMQMLIGIVYFAAAVTKTQTPNFFSGDQIYFWLMTDITARNPVGESMTLWPPMLVAMSIVTAVWEMTFLFVCWKGLPKAFTLVLGLVFHLMTIVMLGLIVFPLVCLSAYWAFFDPQDIRNIGRWMRRQTRQRGSLLARLFKLFPQRMTPPAWATPALSPVGFASVAALAVVVGLETERRIDVYAQAHPEGRHELIPMSPEAVTRMLGQEQRIQPQDQLLGFELGTQTLGGMLANRRTEYRLGEKAVIECAVAPPHGDLWVETNLHDGQNRLIERIGQVMTREKIRTHFNHEWSRKYPPGEYEFVLRIDGTELARRRISLVDHAPVDQTAAATISLPAAATIASHDLP